MNSKTIGALSGIIGVIGLAAQYIPSALVTRKADQPFEGVLPVFNGGQELFTYAYLAEFIGAGVTVGLALGLGYALAQRVDLPNEFGRVVKAVAAGSVLAVSVGTVVYQYFATTISSTAFEVFVVGVQFTTLFVEVGLLVIVGTIAGAAIAYFRTSDQTPGTPSPAPTDSPTLSSTKETGDDNRTDSQPTHCPLNIRVF